MCRSPLLVGDNTGNGHHGARPQGAAGKNYWNPRSWDAVFMFSEMFGADVLLLCFTVHIGTDRFKCRLNMIELLNHLSPRDILGHNSGDGLAGSCQIIASNGRPLCNSLVSWTSLDFQKIIVSCSMLIWSMMVYDGLWWSLMVYGLVMSCHVLSCLIMSCHVL